jgi:hypothetical protein
MEADKLHLETQLTQILAGEGAGGDVSGGGVGTPIGRRWGSSLLMRWRGSTNTGSEAADAAAAGATGGGAPPGGAAGAAENGDAPAQQPGGAEGGSPRAPDAAAAAAAAGMPPLPPGTAPSASPQLPPAPVVLPTSPLPAGDAAAAAQTAYGRLFARVRRGMGPPNVEQLERDASEAKRQLGALESENRHLVDALVQIKMELADVQGELEDARGASQGAGAGRGPGPGGAQRPAPRRRVRLACALPCRCRCRVPLRARPPAAAAQPLTRPSPRLWAPFLLPQASTCSTSVRWCGPWTRSRSWRSACRCGGAAWA